MYGGVFFMLKIENISFSYTSDEVLKHINFNVNKGDYVAIVGESGCGKSTLLEIIYGLLHIEKGAVYWDDKKLLGPNHYLIPGEEFMKYLPQDFDLMPYTTVAENIGKNLSNLDPNKENRIRELLKVVDMSEFFSTKVRYLSGGQKQRVAIAKVLAKEPDVLLLDEPFSHIDNFRKNILRRSLFNYLKSKEITCIVATHDSTDALSFADEIVVIRNSKIEVKGKPEEIYKNPPNAYVASFFNEINEISANEIQQNKLAEETLLFYPNEIQIDPKSMLKGKVIRSYFKGHHYLVEVEFNKRHIFVKSEEKLPKNNWVGLSFKS